MGVDTPNLQLFAEQGVLFRQAHCAGPTCSPSRAALLTGQYAHSCGMLGLSGARGARLNDYNQHLSDFLRRGGYSTALAGIQHEAPDAEAHELLGYEHYLDQPWAPWAHEFVQWNEHYAYRAGEFILSHQPGKPFFLSCGFSLTHRMGPGEQRHTSQRAAEPLGDPRYVKVPDPLPDLPDIRRDFADFCVAVQHLDRCIGIVLEALKTSGLAENTLVIITPDHGLAYPHMKCNLTDHGTGVMLLLRGPGGFDGGKVIDSLVSHVDLFPTICETAGLEKPDWLQGHSLTPLLHGVDSIRDEVFAEVNWHALAEPMRSVRTQRYKYIRRYARRPGPDNCDASVSRSLLRQHQWDSRPIPEESLFDLYLDPNEASNVASDMAYAAVLSDMRGRLKSWMEQTFDPLLTGFLEPQPGMLISAGTDPGGRGETVPAEAIDIELESSRHRLCTEAKIGSPHPVRASQLAESSLRFPQ